jgi:hypothetical protein
MTATKGRPQRWAEAVTDARTALDMLSEAVETLRELRDEYASWRDNLPENLQVSALGEKLDAVVDLDLDVLGEVEQLISEAESLDLPLGFGRD